MSINILGVRVDKTSKHEVLKKVESYLEKNQKFMIVTPNPEIVLKAQKNETLRNVINKADISIPDGVGLKLADLSLKTIKGRELMVDLLALSDRKKLRVYLAGTEESLNKKAVFNIKLSYPHVKVRGMGGPKLSIEANSIDDQNKKIENSMISEINRFKPHVLFVAYGAPKQELWSKKLFSKLNVGGIMVVGGTLDYITSTSVVPKIVSQTGFEWLFRLWKEPRRLGRIINATIVFPLYFLIDKLTPRTSSK